MEPNQAAEQLQTIRTLMERSAIYRRALAPIMTFCGIIGILAGIAGDCLAFQTVHGFFCFWIVIALVAAVGAILLVRRQALKESESFWSPPTRRVLQAMWPPFFCGALAGLLCVYLCQNPIVYFLIISAWCVSFGLGICSAAFFLPRGLKLFGWLFIIIGFLPFLDMMFLGNSMVGMVNPNILMGATFGGLHLACGIYLYFTEKRRMTS